MTNFKTYWIPSTSTIIRRIRGPLVAASLLYVSLMIVISGDVLYTMAIDDTSKIADSYNAVSLHWTSESNIEYYYCIGYVNMYSKSADGAVYAIREILHRLQYYIQVWDKYKDLVENVYSIYACIDIHDKIACLQHDRANVNNSVYRKCQEFVNALKNRIHCVRHDITN